MPVAVIFQSLSHVQLFVTPWIPACQASLSYTISKSLLKLTFIELLMLPKHLIFCCPLLLLPSIFHSIRVFSKEMAFSIKQPKYWSFSFINSPSNEYSGLISFKIDWFDLLECPRASQEFPPTPQFKSINLLALILTLMSVYDYWKNRSFDYKDICWQSNSLA